ncbi:MAG: hypothetical protein LPJ89_10680 [Hymenobacteraceae bacterium]|nr:hypothetical protein [Hymenobacteraceae bacterium]MDX5394857.1 hypothetical protein [Hymenobacteraceae bacterium]MDX5444232.1 hypothetical protein [Hymenobacteraceae bacterium]MDX5510891.1 hypothetical protein [Hymenobacteraceae bacterium]
MIINAIKQFQTLNGETACRVQLDSYNNFIVLKWLKLPAPALMNEVIDCLTEVQDEHNASCILNDIRGVDGLWSKMMEWAKSMPLTKTPSRDWCVANLIDNPIQTSIYESYLKHSLSDTVSVESFEDEQDALYWLENCRCAKS